MKANKDRSIPRLVHTRHGGKILTLSLLLSPYAKRGTLWETYRRHYGQPGSDPKHLLGMNDRYSQPETGRSLNSITIGS